MNETRVNSVRFGRINLADSLLSGCNEREVADALPYNEIQLEQMCGCVASFCYSLTHCFLTPGLGHLGDGSGLTCNLINQSVHCHCKSRPMSQCDCWMTQYVTRDLRPHVLRLPLELAQLHSGCKFGCWARLLMTASESSRAQMNA